MLSSGVFEESEELAGKLVGLLALRRHDDSPRNRVCHLASSVSLEHAAGTRRLLAEGLLPSGLVVLRAQYEALVRAVWALYAASESQIEKLAATLGPESEQSANGLPLVAVMLESLVGKAPAQPVQALCRFRDSSWRALNSYVHAGVHPLQRHNTGYPVVLITQSTKNSNGLAIVAAMQAAVLTGSQELVREVGALQLSHRACLPQIDDA
jgi:hypothetical protein